MTTNSEYGYSFDETICDSCGGDCCIGESGAIWIDTDEIARLSVCMGETLAQTRDKYIEKRAGKDSIKEVKISADNYRCLFFDMATKRCSIYDTRPSQCRTFPFWEYYKDNIEELKKECKAIVV